MIHRYVDEALRIIKNYVNSGMKKEFVVRQTINLEVAIALRC